MITFAVDTSSKACSCAVIEDGKLISESYLNSGLTHSATLLEMIEHTLKVAALKPSQIDRFAVSNGPGSYTGLRIGVSTVKGMAAARQTPCVAVSTLLSLAYNLASFNGTICAALDARVGQVFCAIFTAENGVVTRVTEDAPLTLEQLGEILPDSAAICGDGTDLIIKTFPDKKLFAAPASLRFQRASSVGIIGAQQETVLPEDLTISYLRKSQAEREREEKQNQTKLKER